MRLADIFWPAVFSLMNTECLRIADQLSRAFRGKAWHGPSLQELLAGMTAEQAAARPLRGAHSAWELVLHIEVWTRAAGGALEGVPMPTIVGTPDDWPPVEDASQQAWTEALSRMFESEERLSRAIERFGDDRLGETVPGRKYDFYYLFHGVIQHSLYHGGQIGLLKKAQQIPAGQS
jgi:uncharacterized damage-inducible protein DinB